MRTTEERYWSKVLKNGPEAKCMETGEDLGECWNWTDAPLSSGYGQFWTGDKRETAHRIAWSYENGKMIPDGMVAHHRCENKICVNPTHIKIMTVSEHMKLHHPKSPKKCRRSYHIEYNLANPLTREQKDRRNVLQKANRARKKLEKAIQLNATLT